MNVSHDASCMLHVEGGSHRPSGGRLGKAWDGPRCGSALPPSAHPLYAPRQRLLSCLPSSASLSTYLQYTACIMQHVLQFNTFNRFSTRVLGARRLAP